MDALTPFLGERGRAAQMPLGIRVWGEKAARAGTLDATMGVITVPGADGAYGIASLDAVREAFASWAPNEVFPYAPVSGTRAFREGWRRWIGGKAAGGDFAHPAPLMNRLTLPVATHGVTGALCAVGLIVLDPGERALVPDRRWDGYDTTFGAVCGARVESVRLLDGGGLDLDAWRAAIQSVAREQPRVLLTVNFPHNPTGFVPSEKESESFAAMLVEAAEATGKPIVVLCDDAYEGFVYSADRARWSLFYRLVDRHPLLLPVKCDGITKELLFWGGRVGAATTVFPEKGREEAERSWENKLTGVIRGMLSSVSTPVQTLVGRLLADPVALDRARASVFRSLVERHRAFLQALEGKKAREAFRPDPFHGGLFALLNLGRGDAVAIAERLLEKDRIGVVPFRDERIGLNALRVTYATLPHDRIEELVEKAARAALD